jgi:hypothetical protein
MLATVHALAGDIGVRAARMTTEDEVGTLRRSGLPGALHRRARSGHEHAVACVCSFGSALRVRRFARSSLIDREGRTARSIPAFIKQSRASGDPARASVSVVTGH